MFKKSVNFDNRLNAHWVGETKSPTNTDTHTGFILKIRFCFKKVINYSIKMNSHSYRNEEKNKNEKKSICIIEKNYNKIHSISKKKND